VSVRATEVPAGSAPSGRLDGTRTRVFVYGFLAVLLVAALASLEYWPITGWRLYIEPRQPTHPSWELTSVDDTGREHAVSLYDLPIAYRNTDRQLGPDRDVPPAVADRLCRAWAPAFRDRDDRMVALRVYRTRIDARSGKPLRKQFIHECATATP
jgi:hypothetical protein